MSKLLWIDDEQASFENVQIICEDIFDTIESAFSVSSGYDMIQTSRPDVVLLDIILPPGLGTGLAIEKASRLGRYTGLAIVQLADANLLNRIVIFSLVAETELKRMPAGIEVFVKADLDRDIERFKAVLLKKASTQ